MVIVQEMFRSSLFGFAPSWVSRMHALVFGLIVIFVILYMAGGILGDWDLITKRLKFIKRLKLNNDDLKT